MGGTATDSVEIFNLEVATNEIATILETVSKTTTQEIAGVKITNHANITVQGGTMTAIPREISTAGGVEATAGAEAEVAVVARDDIDHVHLHDDIMKRGIGSKRTQSPLEMPV